MTLHGYLAAWFFAVALALGALVFLLIVHAMNATWPVVYRRTVEDFAALLPILTIGFVPIALLSPRLYHDDGHLSFYLSQPFLVARGFAYLASWSAIALWLRRHGGARERAARAVAAALLPFVGITISLAAFDWLLALTPRWHSTMFAVYVFAGAFVGSLGLVAALAPRDATPSHHGAIGRLLLAFTILWAYTGYFQYLLIWIGSKPDETAYFAARSGWFLAAIRFAIPFFLLLPYGWKRDRRFIAAVGAWCAAGEYVDCVWLVGRWRPLDLLWLVPIGGACALALARRRAPAQEDPRLAKALRYVNE
jgi:hypothetical protein